MSATPAKSSSASPADVCRDRARDGTMIRGVIFDLDGVIVSTDDYHYLAWKRMADEEGIYFDREINERLRGVSRMESLEIVLERSEKECSQDEKQEMAGRKNGYYRAMLEDVTPDDILPGVTAVLDRLRARGVRMAVATSSRNCPIIMERIGIGDLFDAIVDGNDITNTKPDPEIFLLAAERLGLRPAECLVVEDAAAGIEAALAAGMRAMGVGYASRDERAHLRAPGMESVTVGEMLSP